jgi:hypothetical protein
MSVATGEYQPLVWQIVTDAKGFQSIHETNEDGQPGDLVANIFGDHAALLLAAPRLRATLIQLLAIAGTPITARQEAVFAEVRAVISESGHS